MQYSLSTQAKIAAEKLWVAAEASRLYVSGHQRFARSLVGTRPATADQIEAMRSNRLVDQTLLSDGSLGPAGIFDEGRTIAYAANTSKKYAAACRLYSLVKEYQPKTILELGTNIGFSSSYLASAGGKVTTLESSPYRIRLAKELHEKLSLDIEYVQGLFDDTLEPTLERLAQVDLAFIDGNHHYQPTLDYFEKILPFTSNGSLIVFDDVRWSQGMQKLGSC